jgi:glycosyltransferase involved in cell wall biosynthesis
LFTNARNTASRLAKFNGLQAEPLYHPPKLAARLVAGPYTDYVLSVGRIESVKRVDLAIAAMADVPSDIRLVIAGDGTQRQNAERAAAEAGVTDRVTFLGNVEDDDLIALYAGALAVVYPPRMRTSAMSRWRRFSPKPAIT